MDIKYYSIRHHVYIEIFTNSFNSPYKFEAPWDAFEFANHVQRVGSNLVIVSMAWMTREDPSVFSRMPNEPDIETLAYWVTRLEPIIKSDNNREVIVVFCNRTGTEDDATYAGTSAVIGILDGEVKVYGLLGRGDKDILVVDTDRAPYAQLVHKPPAQSKYAGVDDPSASESEADLSSLLGDHSKDATCQRWATSIAALQSPENGVFQEDQYRLVPTTTSSKASSTTSNSTRKRKSLAPIKVPTYNDMARVERVEYGRIEVAPAPQRAAPPAPRPRIVIPPSVLPVQTIGSAQPISAASEASQNSIQSLLSNGSTQTVRSNHRPPEDSTPYPMSGAPLSGYPPNSFRPSQQIYPGIGQAFNSNVALSPPTPSSHSYTASPPWTWTQSERSQQTPLSAVVWESITPTGGEHLTAFPWPPKDETYGVETLNNDITPTDKSKVGLLDQEILEQTQEAKHALDDLQRIIQGFAKTTISSNQQEDNMEKTTSSSPILRRPSAPKSRHASTSRVRERSDSAVRYYTEAPEVLQKLADIPRRATSSNREQANTSNINHLPRRSHSISLGTSQYPVDHPRPSVSVERQASRMRSIASSSQSRRKPSPFPVTVDTTPYNHKKEKSRSLRGRRSMSSLDAIRNPSPAIHSSRDKPDRAYSRGRQPARRHQMSNIWNTYLQDERGRSADSTRNNILHLQKNTRPTGVQSSGSRRRRGSDIDTSNFTRVESVVRTNCPVHGCRPRSVQNLNELYTSQGQPLAKPHHLKRRGTAPPRQASSPEPIIPIQNITLYRDIAKQPSPMLRQTPTLTPKRQKTPQYETLASKNIASPRRATPSRKQSLSRLQRDDKPAVASSNGSKKASTPTFRPRQNPPSEQAKYMLTKSWVISTPSPKTLTMPPAKFNPMNPKTPKAMSFDVNGMLSDPTYNDDEAAIAELRSITTAK